MNVHEWVSKSGRPWSLRVRSDKCSTCGSTPDAPWHMAASDPGRPLAIALRAWLDADEDRRQPEDDLQAAAEAWLGDRYRTALGEAMG